MENLSHVIKTIRLSEKATLLGERNNSYVFEVDPKATKPEIAQAVRAAFGKKVVSVNTANFAGKARRQRTVQFGRTSRWKKAIVKLAPGEKIDLT
ncbi:MAG: 50S ribosomal protein L23 [Verrucomicrobiales bacterium]